MKIISGLEPICMWKSYLPCINDHYSCNTGVLLDLLAIRDLGFCWAPRDSTRFGEIGATRFARFATQPTLPTIAIVALFWIACCISICKPETPKLLRVDELFSRAGWFKRSTVDTSCRDTWGCPALTASLRLGGWQNRTRGEGGRKCSTFNREILLNTRNGCPNLQYAREAIGSN